MKITPPPEMKSWLRPCLAPTLQVEKFDGDPMNYWPFVRQYASHISKKVSNNETKLLLLQQYVARVHKHMFHAVANATI